MIAVSVGSGCAELVPLAGFEADFHHRRGFYAVLAHAASPGVFSLFTIKLQNLIITNLMNLARIALYKLVAVIV